MSPFNKETSCSCFIEAVFIFYHFRNTASYLSKFTIFPTPCVFSANAGVYRLEFYQDLWRMKTRLTRPLCSVVCEMTRLVVLIELPLVSDIQT